ncbi:MAG: GLPGLI family protein [Flavobacteriaceae bacterium]
MKILVTLTAFVLTFTLNAQSFSGKATYKTHRKSNIKFGGEKSTVTPEMQKQLEEKMKKMNQKTYILDFNRQESIYKQDVSLSSPTPQVGNGGVMVMSIGGRGGASDILYKNIKEARFANKTELMGKIFLVKDSLNKYDWEMTGETKNIGKYTCYKATFSREVENMTMSMLNGEMKETKKKETIITTAWYTPDIPVSNGPDDFGGLPGLILEINDGKLTIVCTEIVLNPTNKVEIKEPTKGKEVSREKFEAISRKKSKEMMERFKSNRGGTRHIRIGG